MRPRPSRSAFFLEGVLITTFGCGRPEPVGSQTRADASIDEPAIASPASLDAPTPMHWSEVPSLRSAAPEVLLGTPDVPPQIQGISWDPSQAPEPADLPRTRLWAVHDGISFEPRAAIAAYLWGHGAWFIEFHRDPPDEPDCKSMRWFRNAGFGIRLKQAAPTPNFEHRRVESVPTVGFVDREPDLTGAADVYLQGDRSDSWRIVGAGATSIRIDEVTDSTLEGRIYLASRGADRSLLVGSFRALICELGGPPNAGDGNAGTVDPLHRPSGQR